MEFLFTPLTNVIKQANSDDNSMQILQTTFSFAQMEASIPPRVCFLKIPTQYLVSAIQNKSRSHAAPMLVLFSRPYESPSRQSLICSSIKLSRKAMFYGTAQTHLGLFGKSISMVYETRKMDRLLSNPNAWIGNNNGSRSMLGVPRAWSTPF